MRSPGEYEMWVVRIKGEAPAGFVSLAPGGRTDVHIKPRPKDAKDLRVLFSDGTIARPTAIQRVKSGCLAEFNEELPTGARVQVGDEVIGVVPTLDV
jgi:hypothetical protein